MEKLTFDLRKPVSIPLRGKILCVEMEQADIETASGIKLTTHMTKDALIVVAVASDVEELGITPGSIVEPFLPPQYDGGRTKIQFQEITEFDHNGRFSYKVIYESELASYIPAEKTMFSVNLVDSKDFKPIPKSGIIIPKNKIILPD
jgi:hypothetical protein